MTLEEKRGRRGVALTAIHPRQRHRVGDTLPESSPSCPSPVPAFQSVFAGFFCYFPVGFLATSDCGRPAQCYQSKARTSLSKSNPRPDSIEDRSLWNPATKHLAGVEDRPAPSPLTFETFVQPAPVTTDFIITSKRLPSSRRVDSVPAQPLKTITAIGNCIQRSGFNSRF